MKNKIITSLIALSMVMSLTACNTDKTENSADSNTTTTANSVVSEDTKQDSGSAKIPDGYVNQKGRLAENGMVYFSYPEGYGYHKESIIHQILKDDTSLVAVCFGKKENVKTPEDILHVFDASFGEGVATVCKGFLGRSKIEMISHEPAMVNGWQAEKFVGRIPNVTPDKTWDCHVAGYLFTVDNVHVMVTSLVSDMAQGPEVIAKSDALMEDIAKTIRLGE